MIQPPPRQLPELRADDATGAVDAGYYSLDFGDRHLYKTRPRATADAAPPATALDGDGDGDALAGPRDVFAAAPGVAPKSVLRQLTHRARARGIGAGASAGDDRERGGGGGAARDDVPAGVASEVARAVRAHFETLCELLRHFYAFVGAHDGAKALRVRARIEAVGRELSAARDGLAAERHADRQLLQPLFQLVGSAIDAYDAAFAPAAFAPIAPPAAPPAPAAAATARGSGADTPPVAFSLAAPKGASQTVGFALGPDSAKSSARSRTPPPAAFGAFGTSE